MHILYINIFIFEILEIITFEDESFNNIHFLLCSFIVYIHSSKLLNNDLRFRKKELI